MTMKAYTYYIIFGRPHIGGKLPPPPGGATTFRYLPPTPKTTIGDMCEKLLYTFMN